MIWQDFVLCAASIGMTYALVPQIIQNYKFKKKSINIKTAAITTFCLYIATIIYFTLDLYFAFSVGFLTSTFWLVLLIQSIVYGRKK